MRVAGHSRSAIGTSAVLRLVVGSALTAALFCARAQVITTVAGTDFVFPNTPLAAINAPTGNIIGVAVDSDGNVYVSDMDNELVLKADRSGSLTVVAGNGLLGPTGDGGPATAAALLFPSGVAVDVEGNIFITDGLFQVRKVTAGRIISTIAGNGIQDFSGDGGPAISASLFQPGGVVVDAVGNLFIIDIGNNRIRKITPGGIISTVAGNGILGFSGDGGPATSASLTLQGGDAIAVDTAGNLFITDINASRIRKITPGGIINTVFGNCPSRKLRAGRKFPSNTRE